MDRYNSISRFLKEKFGAKVFKVSLNGGFTCPNRDGSKGVGGCIYCNPESNLPKWNPQSPIPCPERSRGANTQISKQLKEGVEYIKRRHGAAKFISYFQHYSNTYGNIEKLKKTYEEAMSHPDVVGLAISTRPDCLTDETLKLLERLNNETFLWLELGLQSAKEETLKLLNRGHSAQNFADAINRAHSLDIKTCAHIILGLPGEYRNDMIGTIKFLNKLGVGGVKIHNLYILKNTRLAEMFERGEISALSQQEYASLVIDCLERLPPNVLIHRFNGHAPRHLTIAPHWSINKMGTLNAVHEELARRNTFQGRLY